MIKKLSFVDVLAGVLDVLRQHTDYDVYDHFPKDTELPFIHVEIVGQTTVPSKTMWKEDYQLFIHGWAEGSESSVPIFDLIQSIEEAMTVEVSLPEGYELLIQRPLGVQQILKDEDDVRHTIIGYSLQILYGYKTKF
ncbi:DUF5072 family protein [Vagococcus vulneris]|uniref:DUF5072 domain-containing protein n=1 Tax=Vagococcus vulneris TaxID=1977869 RepID=A0A429ZWR4_9ENTE|nr:DUF5072 family protein [Vagococcus vulneris]RST98262.1 DUF5072 domain-containing protein [Vagococcus vulneris]